MDFETLGRQYGAPSKTLKQTWENYQIDASNRQTVEVVRHFEFFTRDGLYLYGPAGSGKTHLASALFNRIVEWKLKLLQDDRNSDQRPYWISLSAFLESQRGSPDERARKRVMDATTLFLDDFGTGNPESQWVQDQVWQLVDHRYSEELQTVITSNYTLEEIGAMYHPRISSRIKAMCIPLPLAGRDRREDETKKMFNAAIRRLNQKEG